jgi:hypothetical protein
MTQLSTPEYRKVEAPFIRQLQTQGWDYLEGDIDVQPHRPAARRCAVRFDHTNSLQ